MSHGERAKTKQVTQDDVIYFVVTDRFFGKNKQHMDGNVSDTNMHGGTLDGIIDKLGYLKELGVTAIWVTPAYKNIHKSGDTEPYHYYWASNFFEMDSRLLDGTHLGRSNDITTFRKFVEICEGKGFKVILDMIVNHAGYGAERHFPGDWFHRQVNNDPNEFTKWVGGLPDFDQDKPEVLDYHIKQLEKWIVDGDVTNIRMDTAKHVDDKFWYYFKSQIRGQYPNTVLIGEVLCEGKDDVSRLERYQNFHDFDSVFDFPLCTALRQTLIYDESIQYWLACPRVGPNEPPGVLDNDNSEKGGYRNPNFMVTLLDNHDLQRRIMSHARTKHTGDSNGLDMAIKVDKLCLGALFTIRGIPQLYYGTELGLEGWKTENTDCDLRRDFPWQMIGNDNHPKSEFRKEREIYEWTKSLIALRKNNAAFRYGTTITLWADNLVYAFLRISTHDVALVIINNGYLAMPDPIQLRLNHDQIPQWVVEFIRNGNLKHWQTRQVLTVHRGDMVHLTVEGKTIDIYCANP
eukprot:TRINITY_DN1730_c0_g1_i1.p1 TRINITY_DN1730_c0_g1~~TRINITY_DN1730_c0_g1_i1.p1  ORF type:complete len:517 (+),score=133.78 TRINITY_DN1730_c0_g1_i1:30-1580(+)